MPSSRKPGLSGYTEDKQDTAFGTMKMQSNILVSAARRWNWSTYFLYIDCTAGPGVDDRGTKSAAIRLIEHLSVKQVELKAHLYERDSNTASRLRQAIEKVDCRKSVFVHEMDSAECLPELGREIASQNGHRPIPGIVYVDPNGLVEHGKAIKKFYQHPCFKRMDCLVHFSATAAKRSKTTPQEYFGGDLYFTKKKWLIRSPKLQWQWTFLLGSNWLNQPRWKNAGWVWDKTPEGKAAWEKVNTVTTRNTSGTRSFELFA